MEYLFFIFIFFIAGVTPELTGFGVATISMSLLPFIFPLSVAIPLVAIISTIATGIIAFQTKTHKVVKYVLPLLFGSLTGVVIGMIFLSHINEDILRLALGVFLVTYGLYGFFIKGHFLPTGKLAGAITGLAAGFFGASFNIHGPIVGVYSSSKSKLSKIEVKDLIATYMFFTGSFTVVGHAVSGRITREVLTFVLFALPFLFVGLFVGKRLFNKLNANWVRRGVYFFVLIAGLTFLI